MKALKWIIIIIVLLIGGYLIFSASQPNQLKLEESIKIDAPAERIYAELVEFKNWHNWSAWDQLDSNMKSEYSEEMGKVGSWSQWWSEHPEVGNGRQEIVEIKDGEYIKSAMIFEGFDATNYAEFILEEAGDSTLVRWTYIGGKTPFYFNAMNTFIEPRLRTNYEKSLKQFKAYVEAMPDRVPLPAGVEMVELETQPIISILDSTTAEGISAKLRELYIELNIYAESKGLNSDGMPLAIYHNYSEDKVVLEGAIPVAEVEVMTEGRIMQKIMPAGKAIKGIHYGDYDGSEDLHFSIGDYIEASKYEMIGSPWEVYANDPTLVDSAKVETHIYYPVNMN